MKRDVKRLLERRSLTIAPASGLSAIEHRESESGMRSLVVAVLKGGGFFGRPSNAVTGQALIPLNVKRMQQITRDDWRLFYGGGL